MLQVDSQKDKLCEISWNFPVVNGPEIKSLSLKMKRDGDEMPLKDISASILHEQYNLTDLENGIEYTLSIFGENTVGVGKISEEVKCTPGR